ncbi:alpha/beta hydrolase [Novosphingobium kaempferiae]|uniref:alpha/beta hydrolase n=1 Tax=Novosphingobium kaempferiae TaxID=2896849 RepID=UPI001E47142D|nr:alpha/beta hydrolase [Novosphingobium kaempferiae]
MNLDRRTLFAGAIALGLTRPAVAGAATKATGAGAAASPALPFDKTGEVIDLWPGTPPGAPSPLPVERATERSANPAQPDRVIAGIARPRITAFRPKYPNGAALLVIPGGGYREESFDKGGVQVAQWLAEHGYTAFVLTYRLPGEGWQDRSNTPLADAQRAMRLIRARAKAYGIEPERVAVMGSSAGGHLCADLASRFDFPAYAPVDATDKLSARPFCAAPLYPVVSMDPAITHAGSREKLLGPNPTPEAEAAHSIDRIVTTRSPPHFIVHAEDDATVPVENSLRLRAALRAAGVTVDLHLFAEGGHGFNLWNIAGKPVAAWPSLWLDWASRMGLG